MKSINSYGLSFFFVLIGIVLLSFYGLLYGDIDTDFQDLYLALTEYSDEDVNQVIIREIRLPRILMAIISGAALSIAGMLMQTLFQNPLAGPYVLGINSGSSLMVALGLLSGIGIFNSELGLIGSALVGAFIFGLFILFTASFLRNQIGLLLFGVMLGSFVSSIITILEVGSHAESLKAFSLWSMGSLNGVSIQQLPIICIVFIFTCFLTIFIVKPLNILVLGEEEVRLMGYDVKKLRILVVFVTAVFTGLITAFCGPIAFVGLAVPNLTRMLFKTQDHMLLFVANLLFGAFFLLGCDVVTILFSDTLIIPINALTSLIGAPFVIYILISKLR
ncbi:MAG: FecCD family ABC transporter permease [Crocinitomicaceae bacterium]|jgi:iron complex transport system permease protein